MNILKVFQSIGQFSNWLPAKIVTDRELIDAIKRMPKDAVACHQLSGHVIYEPCWRLPDGSLLYERFLDKKELAHIKSNPKLVSLIMAT